MFPFFAPVVQVSLIPPVRPVAPPPAVRSETQAIVVGGIDAGPQVPGEIAAAASLAQAKELNTDLWFTFVFLTSGLALGIWAGGRRRS